MSLNQSFNHHHSFEIKIDFEELNEKWMESPAGIIGESVIITMKHKQGRPENLFNGIITNVAMSGYHGQQNSVVISGKSSTIKLDEKKQWIRLWIRRCSKLSTKVYTSEANLPLNPIILTKKEQEDLVEVEKTRAIGYPACYRANARNYIINSFRYSIS